MSKIQPNSLTVYTCKYITITVNWFMIHTDATGATDTVVCSHIHRHMYTQTFKILEILSTMALGF